jgi:hypothetical protein
MSASSDEVHIRVITTTPAPAGAADAHAIPFDQSSEWVKKDQWPTFDNWEYTVIFKENLQGAQLDDFRKFLGLVEKTGLTGKLFKSPSNSKQLLLKLKAPQAWYDERATKLSYMYELKPIVCKVPKQYQDKHPGDTAITNMYEVFDADEKENFMFEGYHNMYTSFRGSMIEYAPHSFPRCNFVTFCPGTTCASARPTTHPAAIYCNTCTAT